MRKIDLTKEKPILRVISKNEPIYKEDLFYLMDEADRLLRLRRAREKLPSHMRKEEDVIWVNFPDL